MAAVLCGCEPEARVSEGNGDKATRPPVRPVEIAIAKAVQMRSGAASERAQRERDGEAHDERFARVLGRVDPNHRKLAHTRQWLAGYWVNNDRSACRGTDFGVRFEADGTFTDYWDSGRYELSGDRITRITTALTDQAEPGQKVGDRSTFILELVGPNELRMDFGGGVKETYFRCPGDWWQVGNG